MLNPLEPELCDIEKRKKDEKPGIEQGLKDSFDEILDIDYVVR